VNEPDDTAKDEALERLRAEYAALPVTAEVDLDGIADGARRTRRRQRVTVAAAAAAVAVVAGGVAVWAGTNGPTDDAKGFPPAATSYDGPLSAPGRYGAAGKAIDCVNPPTGSNRTEDVYSQGATSDTPRGAVDTAYSEGLFLEMPRVDLAVAATEEDRQMLTYESSGRVLLALVVHNGPAASGTGGDGWYVETVARCDFAEFPAADRVIAGMVDYGIWTDEDGVPVPVTKVYSSPGPAHCSWESMTFLILDEGTGRRSRSYIENPNKELRDYIAAPYLRNVPLPDDARDTGWQRNGRHLWLSTDGRYAYVGTVTSVDAWPRFDSGCD
jgi:hypothetical protein